MKNTIILLALLSLLSCKEVVQVPVEIDHFKNTKWSKLDFTDSNGKDVYKVVEFTQPDIVKISWRYDKIYLYTYLGEYTYLSKGQKVWVRNGSNTIYVGSITKDQFELADEIFLRYR